jgi:hypothetical protein
MSNILIEEVIQMAAKKILSLEEIQNLIDLYNEGNSLRKIASITGYSRTFVTKVFNENNLVRRTNKINSRKYFLNDNYFDVIDSSEKAYWLGFIAADGYITSKRQGEGQKFGITLSNIDHGHLDKLNICLNSTYPINVYNASNNYSSESVFCRLLVSSDQIVNSLKNLGIVENKTLILQFPSKEQVPDTFIMDYIRGYMDGDGAISFYRGSKTPSCIIGFTGQKEFLEMIQYHLGINLKLSTKDGITYQFNIGGNNQCLNILNKLYKNSTENSRLERKYNKYLELINIVKTRV